MHLVAARVAAWVRAAMEMRGKSLYPEYLIMPHMYWLDERGQRRMTLAYAFGRLESA